MVLGSFRRLGLHNLKHLVFSAMVLPEQHPFFFIFFVEVFGV